MRYVINRYVLSSQGCKTSASDRTRIVELAMVMEEAYSHNAALVRYVWTTVDKAGNVSQTNQLNLSLNSK